MPLVTHSIGGSRITLDSRAFTAYLRCIAAGMPSGGINSSYRDPIEQGRIFLANYTRLYDLSSKRDPRRWNGDVYWRKAPYHRHVAVAVPYTSQHNYGLALDLDDNQRAWMRYYGEAHGWHWPDWARKAATYEPWHFEFDTSHHNIPEDDMFDADDRDLLERIMREVRVGREGEHPDGPLASLVRDARNQGSAAKDAARATDAGIGRVGEQNTYIINLIKELDARVGRTGEQNTYIIELERKALAALKELTDALDAAEGGDATKEEA